jgi:hypothetical protein
LRRGARCASGWLAAQALAAGLLVEPTGAAHPPGFRGEPTFLEQSLECRGELLLWRTVDQDGDGSLELLVVEAPPEGRRQLRLHAIQGGRVDSEPRARMDLLEDITAVGLAELDPKQPGREVLLLTPRGAYSYSLNLTSYRGNVKRLVEADLLYDFPRADGLGWWPFVLPAGGEGGGDDVLYPCPDALSLLRDGALIPLEGPAPRGSSADAQDGPPSARAGAARVELEVRGGKLKAPFVGEDAGGTWTMAEDGRSLEAPALVDFDGDGDLDLVFAGRDGLRVHASEGGRFSPAVTTRAEWPAYLGQDPGERELRLLPAAPGRRPDLLAILGQASDQGLGNSGQRLMLLRQGPEGPLPEKPQQVLSFEAARLTPSLADLDGDGRTDLVVRQFRLPDFSDVLTGLEFELSFFWYRGDGRGFERQPTLRDDRTYDEEQMDELIARRVFGPDLSGDGLGDLVEVDLQGRISIRRLIKDSGFFSGTTWTLERAPWKRFDTAGSIQELEVRDINGDGLADVLSAGDRGVTVILSQGGRR